MNYALISDSGDINIPELQNIDYKGLKLIGRNTPNWNEPIQQNFIKLADKIDILEAKLAEAGKNTINNASGFTFTSISDIQNDDEWIAIFENKRNSDETVAVNMDTLRAMSYGVVCVDSSTDEYLFISAEDFNKSLTFDNFDNHNGSVKIDDGEIGMSFGNYRGGSHYGWAMYDTRLNSITNSETGFLNTDSETNTVLLSMYVK